jgi:hypothetical protein
MVLIEVEGTRFNVPQQDIEGSKVIEDLINYNNYYDLNTQLSIMVPISDWYEYLQFLDTGKPSLSSLRVINYLDNAKQASTWFWNTYYNSDQSEKSEEEILRTIHKYTEFTMEELFPILTTLDLIKQIPYLNVSTLPEFYIEHLIGLEEDIPEYYEMRKFAQFSNVPSQLLQETTRIGFIIKPIDQEEPIFNKNYLPCKKRKDGITHISQYVAEYYPNLRVYDISSRLRPRPFLTIGPADSPYLMNIIPRHQNQPRTFVWTDNPGLEGYKPENVYNPHSTYRPYTGHNTGIKINNCDVYSYNNPSLYGRDYYIFDYRTHDPVSNILYVISI